MKDNKDKVINLSKVNESLTSPTFEESYHKDIVPYGKPEHLYDAYAPNGAYPDKLLALYYQSSLHAALIDGITFRVTGGGVEYSDEESKTFGDNINGDETVNDISSKLEMDKRIFGGYASFVTFSRDFSKIKNVKHVPFDKLRMVKYEMDDDNVVKQKHIYYSMNWIGTKRPKKYKYEVLDFNKIKLFRDRYESLLNSESTPENLKSLSELANRPHTFIYYNINYTAGRDYYPLPSYVGAINDIDAYQQASVYFNNVLKKGMNSDGMLLIPGDSKTEQFQDEAELLKQQYAGNLNAGELMIAGYTSEEDKPEYVTFSMKGSDGRLEQIVNTTSQNILTTHKITSPLLVGIKTAGQLGGSTELKEAEKIFYENVIKPAQIALGRYWNRIFEYNNLEQIYFKNIEIINSEDNSEINSDNNNDNLNKKI